MRKQAIAVSLSLLLPSLCWAQDAAPVPAAAPVAPVAAEDASKTPPPVGATGESQSAPAPEAMTARPGEGVFITLTRTALKDEGLPFNTQKTTPEEFKSYNAQNAGDAISRMTGVNVGTSAGQLGTLRLAGIRGATSNQTLVLIDGRPMGGVALSGSQDLSEIPVEQIDHIEVVRGGISALYGPNAVGGVINIISKRATYQGEPISHVGYEMASYDKQKYRLDFGSRAGPLDYFFFGDQQWQSGFRDNADARSYNIGGNAGLSMGKAGKLMFDVAGYNGKGGVPGQLFPPIPTNQFDNSIEKQAATPDARQDVHSEYVRGSYILPLPGESLMSLRGYGSQRRAQFEIPTFFVGNDRHEQTKGAEAQFNLPWGLTAGGVFNRDRLDNRDLITVTNNYIAAVENWGVFGQEDFRWRWLAAIPSLRYDHNSVAGDATNPRIQLIADATPWLRFSGSAGGSFRAPTIDDLYTPFTDYGGGLSYQGNPNLEPEKAWTYDAGFQVGHESCTARAGYFRSNITDLIQTTSDLAATTINVGEARRQGAEFQINHAVNNTFRHEVNYTYLNNTGKPLGFSDFVVLRLSPRHTVNYLASLMPFKNFRWDNTLKYVGSQYEGNGQSGAKLGDYLLWGMRFAYQIRQLEVFVGVDDLNNKRYQERSGYPLPGITGYGGLTLRLWG